MAYNTEDLYKQAIELTKEDGVHFIDDVIAGLPCSKPTFYDHFKVNSNQFNNIKEALEHNRIQVKRQLRKKWKISDNAALQLSLYKLIGTEEERKKLSQQFQDHSFDNELQITVKREKKPPIDER